MNSRKRSITWTCAGIMFALLAGTPVVADDTELLLVVPPPNDNPKPNMLFILDTSGSMDTEESTQAPYDSSMTYAGDCDTDSLYWTDVDVTPDCSAGGNTQFVEQASFVCISAMGQLDGIGSYSDTFVQYRPTIVPAISRWQDLEPGNNTGLLECQADAGVHGDGTAGYLWPSNGADGNVFANNSAFELSWGSAPANVSYSVYDGNYINWKNTPNTVNLQRIDIVKAVTTAVLKSITNVNVGVMRFNNDAGGPVIKALSDLDTDRAGILATIDGLTATGNTPLSETLYEAALYWRGVNAYYGESVSEYPTDPAALDSSGPENYKQPETNVCSKNFNILLTDGIPNNDDETPSLVTNLPAYATTLGRSNCDGTVEGGMCLDDVAEYLSKVDIDAVLAGDQHVTTHTIGFTVDLPILRDTAGKSGGSYFLADDVESLALALLNIVDDVTSRSLSFTAPGAAVNAFNRTQNLNDLYMTVFQSKTNVHWPGNLKKYRVDNGMIVDANGLGAINPATGFFDTSAESFWSGSPDGNDIAAGGAASQLPDPLQRKLYTNNGNNNLTAASNELTPSNAGAYSLADFGLTGASGEPSIDQMIRWMRGEDLRDEDFNPATTVRKAMGDPLHSQPAAVVYGGTAANPETVVFAATNDGYLHAIDGATGAELWSYVPKELLSDMNRLYFDPRSKFKHYGIDGNIVSVVADRDRNGIIDGTDLVYIVFGLRRGGNTYYALDVTNKTAPRLLWNVSLPGGGQSWSTPVVSRVNVNTAGLNADKAVVIIGGGYDSVHDTNTYPSSPDVAGTSIHMRDLVSGAELWRADRTAGADLQLASMTRAIPTRPRVIDVSGDGFADRIYASDMGGQLLRFDIKNGETPTSLVAGGVIAQLGAEGLGSPTAADTRRFYNSPDASIFVDRNQNRRFISLSIGSGYRAHPLDNSATDRFYSVRDPDVFNQLSQAAYDSYDIVTDADLVEVSGQVRTVIDPTDRGWKFTLPANQKVISDSTTFDNSVFFVAFSPEANTADVCQPSLGKNFLYRVDVENGDPVVNNLDTLDPADADAERVEELAQGGIAPTPTFLFPSPDPSCTGAACSPPPLGCVGMECFNPGFVNNPVRTLWTQDGIE